MPQLHSAMALLGVVKPTNWKLHHGGRIFARLTCSRLGPGCRLLLPCCGRLGPCQGGSCQCQTPEWLGPAVSVEQQEQQCHQCSGLMQLTCWLFGDVCWKGKCSLPQIGCMCACMRRGTSQYMSVPAQLSTAQHITPQHSAAQHAELTSLLKYSRSS